VRDLSDRNVLERAVDEFCIQTSYQGRILSLVCVEGEKRMGVPRYGEKGRRRFVLTES
jgi:hypothetical protein